MLRRANIRGLFTDSTKSTTNIFIIFQPAKLFLPVFSILSLVFSFLNFYLQILFELGSGGSLLSDSEELTAEVDEFGFRKLRISILVTVTCDLICS